MSGHIIYVYSIVKYRMYSSLFMIESVDYNIICTSDYTGEIPVHVFNSTIPGMGLL